MHPYAQISVVQLKVVSVNVLAPAFSEWHFPFFPVFRLHHEEKDEYPGVHLIKLLPSSLTIKSNKLECLSTMSSNSGNSGTNTLAYYEH
jgi:hypothetical protein